MGLVEKKEVVGYKRNHKLSKTSFRKNSLYKIFEQK